jgi:glyoxylase-like metal-dependent hydrolase (beta-lactamase superfamily II)
LKAETLAEAASPLSSMICISLRITQLHTPESEDANSLNRITPYVLLSFAIENAHFSSLHPRRYILPQHPTFSPQRWETTPCHGKIAMSHLEICTSSTGSSTACRPAPNSGSFLPFPLAAFTNPLQLLDLGRLDSDASNALSGANIAIPGAPRQEHARCNLIMIAALIHYPGYGLILFDVGSCEDSIAHWAPNTTACLPRIWSKDIHSLPAAIAASGAGTIADLKAVVLSHLHFDHAGGLEHFFHSDVEIWVHETELKNSFWACATRIDAAMYNAHYLSVDKLNWKTFSEQHFSIWQGITLHRCPGHTDGSVVMEVTMQGGTVVLTGDLFHVKENYEDGRPQGPLMRDFNAWHRSRLFVRNLVERTRARVVLGHDVEYFERFERSPRFME